MDSSVIEKRYQNNTDDTFIEASVLQTFYLTAFQFVKTAILLGINLLRVMPVICLNVTHDNPIEQFFGTKKGPT